MLSQLQQQLQFNIDEQNFVKLTLSKPRQKSSDLKNIYVRLVLIKDQANFSFTYRYKTKDQVKNFEIESGINELISLMETTFRNATLLSTDADYQYQITKKEKVLVNKQQPSITVVPPLEHDRQKIKRSSANESYLYYLGVTNKDGEVIPKMADKYRQINKYLEIIESLVDKAELPNKLHTVDMGSGKGYLTFALYDYLKNKKGLEVIVTGIELRTELVDLCNDVATKCGFENLNFTAERIENYSTNQIDILIALHACDTATDDALKKGIVGDSALIICAPCCHKQVRQQVKGKEQESPLLKYGIFQERQFEMITDTIRALILEKHQYSTKVFEFISNEHTRKNVMLVGTKQSKQIPAAELDNKIKSLKEAYHIDEHYLETILDKE